VDGGPGPPRKMALSLLSLISRHQPLPANGLRGQAQALLSCEVAPWTRTWPAALHLSPPRVSLTSPTWAQEQYNRQRTPVIRTPAASMSNQCHLMPETRSSDGINTDGTKSIPRFSMQFKTSNRRSNLASSVSPPSTPTYSGQHKLFMIAFIINIVIIIITRRICLCSRRVT
jgi:hypothetical protein